MVSRTQTDVIRQGSESLEASFAELSPRYAFVDRDAVWAFVREHPRLIDVLIRAQVVIPEYFTPTTVTYLEVWESPEDPEPPSLYASIRSDLTRDEERARLRRFREEWLYDRSNPFFESIHFGID